MHSIIYTYTKYSIRNSYIDIEILGNVADVCPVGALTIRPSSYTLRVWEVVATETSDVLDSLCSNIRIDTCGATIVRISPRLHSEINDEWITEKIRFSAAGLISGRLLVPTINRSGVNIYGASITCQYISQIHAWYATHDASTVSVSWEYAFRYIAYCFLSQLTNSTQLETHSFMSYTGGSLDMFSAHIFKLACAYLCFSNINSHVQLDADMRMSYLFTDTLTNLFTNSKVLLLLAINMRKEAPVINIRLSSNMSTNVTFNIGAAAYYVDSSFHLGISSNSLYNFMRGSTYLSTVISNNANQVTCITGSAFNSIATGLQYGIAHKLFSSINSVSLLVSNIHTREICALSSYNIRNVYI